MPDVKTKDDRPRLSRREQYERALHPFDDPPEPDNYGYLVSWWGEAGMIQSGDMGPKPLSFQELEAFSRMTRLGLTAWEARQIIALSRRYCWAQHEYKKQGIPAPYQTKETVEALQELRESQRRLTQKFKDLKIFKA